MKIAVVVPGFSRDPDDWAIPALQTLACRLGQQYEVHVFSLRYPAAGRYRFCNLVHHAIGGGTRAGLRSLDVVARAVRALVAEHRRAPFDLFHAFWVDEPAFTALLAGGLCRRPVVASLGGGELVDLPEIGYGTWGSRWRRRMIRLVLGRATLITTGSPSARRLCIERGGAPTKVQLAPLGVDTDLFRPGDRPAQQGPVVIQAASLTPVKNQKLLLDVVARVRTHYQDLRVFMAGDGPLEKALRAYAARLEIGEAVVLKGPIPYPGMPTFYRRGDLYLQTSRHESQGMSVLEAMACGLPVLGTPVGLLPAVGALPATADPEELAEEILALLSDRRALAEAGRRARALCAREYSLDATVTRFLDLYHTAFTTRWR